MGCYSFQYLTRLLGLSPKHGELSFPPLGLSLSSGNLEVLTIPSTQQLGHGFLYRSRTNWGARPYHQNCSYKKGQAF